MSKSFKSLKQQITEFKKQADYDFHYVVLAVMNSPEYMVQCIEVLRYQVCLTLEGDTQAVKTWLKTKKIKADLRSARGWLTAAAAMWEAWSCTNNPARHIVEKIVWNMTECRVYSYDLLKAAKA